jgi:hypothetical protein
MISTRTRIIIAYISTHISRRRRWGALTDEAHRLDRGARGGAHHPQQLLEVVVALRLPTTTTTTTTTSSTSIVA